MATRFDSTAFRASPFMRALSTPLADAEQQALRAEVYNLESDRFYPAWMAANEAYHAFQALHWRNLQARMIKVGQQDRSAEAVAAAAAHLTISLMIDAPARNRSDIATKRVMARRVIYDPTKWPAEWKEAIQRDEDHFDRIRASRKGGRG